MTQPPASRPHATRLIHNTAWNLAGLALPLVVAVLAMPALIAGLGPERFGFLTVVWVVVGYFGLLDLGVGQATTRSVAARIDASAAAQVPGLVWNSLLISTALGLAGAALLAGAAPLVDRLVTGPGSPLGDEGLAAIRVLAASVPFLVLSSALRGTLEGLGRFDLVNAVRIPASIVNYAAPLAVIAWTRDLAWVVLVIAVGRALACIAYGVLTVRLVPLGAAARRYDAATARGLLGFGGWLTVTNILTPVIVSVERFVIAALISLAAVADYAAPFEIITKLWIVSAALMGALFPALSAVAAQDTARLREMCMRALGALTALALPAVALLITWSPELLTLWLGPGFAGRSSMVAQILAAGMLVSIAAQVPLTALHAAGRADVTARLLAAELPLYLVLVVWLTSSFGIAGAALGWLIRASVDCVLLFALCERVRPGCFAPGDWRALLARGSVAATFLAAFGATSALPAASAAKTVAFLLCLLGVAAWSWKRLLHNEQRRWACNLLHRRAGGA